jgi:acetyl esterase/lipase
VTLFGNIDAGVLRALLPQLPTALRTKPCEVGDIECRRRLSESLNQDLGRRFGKASDVTLKDHWIPRADGSQLRVRVYRKIDSNARGALLYVHGGGMIVSSIEDYDERCMHYCTNTGLPVVSVDYPLAPEAPHPAQIDDALVALAWMHDSAEAFGWDVERIGIGGDSAGGGLTAGTVLKNRDTVQLPLACQLLVYPMLDDRNVIPDPRFPQAFQIWTYVDNQTGWDAYLSGLANRAEVPIYAAPARATDLSGLPPTYIDTGTLDIFYDEDLAYAKQLIADGVSVEGHIWNGAPHGFDYFAFNSSIANKAWQARFAFLIQHLA